MEVSRVEVTLSGAERSGGWWGQVDDILHMVNEEHVEVFQLDEVASSRLPALRMRNAISPCCPKVDLRVLPKV